MNILFLVPNDWKETGGLLLPLTNYKTELEKFDNKVLYFELPYHLNMKNIDRYSDKLNEYVEKNKINCLIGFTLNQSYMLAKQLKINDFNGQKIGLLMDSMRLNITSIMKSNQKKSVKGILKKFIYTYKERKCLSFYDKNIYVSDVDVKYVKNFYNVKNSIYYLPNGTKLQDVDVAGIKDDRFRIGCLAGLIGESGNEDFNAMLYDVFPRLREEYGDKIEFIFTGRNPSKRMEEYFYNEKNIQYLGFIDDLKDFYEKVDIITTTVKKECGIINRILEAWSYGKIVIGYRKNFKTFTQAEENVHYLAADTPDEFIYALEKIKNDKIYARNIAMNGYMLVKNYYTWTETGKKLNEIINK